MIRSIKASAFVVGTAAAGAAGVAGYLLSRFYLHQWGVTDVAVARALPGDALIEQPNLVATLAITIDAPPEQVWPWIVQLRQGRGGWYSYDWLENLLGLDIHTADRILPQFQELHPGDVVPTGAIDIPVIAVEPNRVLLLGGAEYATIAFVLERQPEQRTRLIVRNRAHIALTPSGLMWYALLYPALFIMSRKMLLTIKQRVERGPQRARRSNRPWFNRVVGRIAGHRGSPFALVEHVGRRSGRIYRTPVEALWAEDGFVIPLGHGSDCDWCRNSVAAHGCRIVRNGITYQLADPHVIDLDDAAPLLSPLRRWIYQRSGARSFLRLHQVQHHVRAPAPDQTGLIAANVPPLRGGRRRR